MKLKSKVNLGIYLVFGIFAGFILLTQAKPVQAGYENTGATDGTNANNSMECNRTGAAKDCYFNVPNSNQTYYQAYRGWAKSWVSQEFGSNANVIIHACLTKTGWGDNSGGPCNFLYSGNPTANYAYMEWGIKYITDEYVSGTETTVQLKGDNEESLEEYKYVSYHIYVSNVHTRSNLHAQGRRVYANSFTANGGESISITQGQSADLQWVTTYGYRSVVITYPGGTVPTNGAGSGTVSVSPLSTTTYTLIAQGPGINTDPPGPDFQYWPGRVEKTVTITVQPAGVAPGPFSIHSVYCFNWPNVETEVNAQESAGATSYSLERREGSGGWVVVFDHVSADYIDNNTDYVNKNTEYEYRVIAHNAQGNTTSTNTDSILTNQANCSEPPLPDEICGNGIDDDGDGQIDEGCTVPGVCTDNSTVSVIQALPGTLTAGQTYPFTVRVTNTGNSIWYHGDAYKFSQSTGYSIVSTAPNNVVGLNYGHLPYAVHNSDYVDWTFNLTAPASSGTLSMRMFHRAGWAYIKEGGGCSAPGSDTQFGSQLNMNFTVGQPPVSTISFVITYTPKTLLPPTNPGISNSTCSQLNLTWDYTSNGAEDGFNIYRSTDNITWGSPINGSLVSAAARSYLDTPPSTGVTYYYRIATHRSLNIEPREAWTSTSVDAQNVPCTGNLLSSSMSLTHVNGAPFSGATVIKENDVLTYRILVINTGPANVSMNRICARPSANLINPGNLSVSDASGNAVNGGIQANNGECIALDGYPLRFSVTGTKNIVNNWIITYTTTFDPQSNDSQEIISNRAYIYYTDNAAKKVLVTVPSYLANTFTPAPPIFREVAP